VSFEPDATVTGRWQRCTFSVAAFSSHSASADLYVPRGFQVDFALPVLSLAQGTGKVNYLKGFLRRQGWLAILEMP